MVSRNGSAVMKKGGPFVGFLFLLAFLTAGCDTAGDENTMLGMERVQQLDYEGAMAAFSEAQAAGEDPQMVYRGMGLACMRMTDYQGAAENLEKALEGRGPRPDSLD